MPRSLSGTSVRRVTLLRVSCVICFVLLLNLQVVDAQNEPHVFFDEPTGARYRVEQYAPAYFPVGMVFAPDGRLFYNEKITGNLRVITADGRLQREPVFSVAVDALQERGMLGVALDPNFEENNTMYVVYTALGTAREWPTNKLVRFTIDENNIAGEAEELFALPIDNGFLLHNGGNVHFDEEGLLYLSIGDYGEAYYSQDLTSPNGKIHRFEVTDEGLIPAPGNPFADSSVYAYGFRNPFDFTFDPINGVMWTTENGPDCDDEVNLVIPGFNYGWSEDYPCYGMDLIPDMPDYMPPHFTFTPPIGISGITFYESNAIPQWENDLFFCGWNFGELYHVELDESRTRVVDSHILDLGDVSCKLDILTGPDGALYFGTVGDGDGFIYRIVPA